MRLIVLVSLGALAVSAPGQSLPDAEIQSAINAGRAMKTKAAWGSIQKLHSLRINREGIGDSVGKTVVFMGYRSLVLLEAAEAARRHQTLSVVDVKNWPDSGATRILLIAQAGGIYIGNIPKWQAPAVHMTITADGVEIQPLSETGAGRSQTVIGASQTGLVSRNGPLATFTPLYESALYNEARSRTWFSFDIPQGAKHLTVTVISVDGHEKHKDFDSGLL